MQIGIIGMGWVGTSIAISTPHSGIANELLLHDVRTNIAEGEALDLAHGASFYPSAHVRAATIDDMANADAVVIAAGEAERPTRHGSTCCAITPRRCGTLPRRCVTCAACSSSSRIRLT